MNKGFENMVLASLIGFIIIAVLFCMWNVHQDKRIQKIEAQPVSLPVVEQSDIMTYESCEEYSMDEWIDYCAGLRQLDPDLIRAIIEKESQWNPTAHSDTNDMGLMQINEKYWAYYINIDPFTLEDLNVPKDDPYDICANVLAGCNALADWRRICMQHNSDLPIDYINCYNKGNTYFNSFDHTYSDAVLNIYLKNKMICD